MTTPVITDAMVEKAWDAAMDKADAPELNCSSTMIRAALEAAAPSLRAEGMRACAETVELIESGNAVFDGDQGFWITKDSKVVCAFLSVDFRSRAAEIEGGKG